VAATRSHRKMLQCLLQLSIKFDIPRFEKLSDPFLEDGVCTVPRGRTSETGAHAVLSDEQPITFEFQTAFFGRFHEINETLFSS